MMFCWMSPEHGEVEKNLLIVVYIQSDHLIFIQNEKLTFVL